MSKLLSNFSVYDFEFKKSGGNTHENRFKNKTL